MSACPSCGDDANVQKVSGIYRSRGRGGPDDDLAALLAPPRPPLRPLAALASASATGGSGSLGGPGPIAAYGGVMALLGGAVGWFWSPDPLSPMTYAWVGIMTGLIVGIVVGIVYSALRGAGASSAAASEPAVLRPTSSEQQRLLDLWEQAYYCRKHDAVILPGEPKTLSPPGFRCLMAGERDGAASGTTPDQERHSRP